MRGGSRWPRLGLMAPAIGSAATGPATWRDNHGQPEHPAVTRRRKTSPAKDLIDIVALLPGWAGAAMAALAYPLLHGITSQQTEVTGQPGPITSVALQGVLNGLATAGQCIVPAGFLAGAGGSAWRRRPGIHPGDEKFPLRRSAKRGANASAALRGCTGFPTAVAPDRSADR